jgi:hypothetical protein
MFRPLHEVATVAGRPATVSTNSGHTNTRFQARFRLQFEITDSNIEQVTMPPTNIGRADSVKTCFWRADQPAPSAKRCCGPNSIAGGVATAVARYMGRRQQSFNVPHELWVQPSMPWIGRTLRTPPAVMHGLPMTTPFLIGCIGGRTATDARLPERD